MISSGAKALKALPASVRVGGIDYKVIVGPAVDRYADYWGFYEPGEEELFMWEGIKSGNRVVEVFTHELLHAAWKQGGIMDGDEEERTVTVLARALAAVFRDNPWYGKWIAAHSG